MMINDRSITISAAGSRQAKVWPGQTLLLSELYGRLQTPVRGAEIMAEYLALKKSQQDERKDVGGFVGGVLRDGRRKADCVVGRDLLTLDLDHLPAGGAQEALRRVEGLGCGYAVYSTRKHRPDAPRLRVLLPLDRACTADEYEPLARKMAEFIGLDWCDPTTFEASRLMYWPSCCKDGEYVFVYGDKPLLSADGVLALYADWRDIRQWPEVPGAQQSRQKLAARQGDPTAKEGIVGAFCRTYDVYKAMETFLPGVYLPTDLPDRWTYAAGSTAGGAVIYEDGRFLYSHHGTDPCGGRLCNAWDLVRLHRFAELDDEAAPGTPANRLPSFSAMRELAAGDAAVAASLDREKQNQVLADFGAIAPAGSEDASGWRGSLQKTAEGKVLKTVRNVLLALQLDPLLQGHIRYDSFNTRLVGTAPLPWEPRRTSGGEFLWGEADDAGLRDYVERSLGFRGKDVIDDALLQCAMAARFDPVDQYLEGLIWDGVPRLDTLFVDYFGAEDCPYTRAVTRKAFTAAVARIKQPGVKFDNMTVICGRQGTGKTTLILKMGRQWATNSVESFDGKDAAELLQGKWLVEVGELGAMNNSERNSVKSFLSKTEDQYRAPYARRPETRPRRCVFFGTTNDHDYLRDPTGNRRYWPVDIEATAPKKNVFQDLDGEVDQLWAEAVVRWREGEKLVLAPELEAEAERRRGNHMEIDPLKGQIEAFLSQAVPEEWPKWNGAQRAAYLSGGSQYSGRLVHRDRTCALEIWRECLHESRAIPRVESRRINEILGGIAGWERSSTVRCGMDYGTQKGFVYVSKSTSDNVLWVNQQNHMGVNLVNEYDRSGLQEGLHTEPHS